MATLLSLIVKASTQGHDEARLKAELVERIPPFMARLPRRPYLSPRLLRLSEQPALLKAMDADDLLVAIRQVIGPKQSELADELVALTLIVARLGGVCCAVRIGLLAMEELRARRAAPKHPLS